MMQMNTIRYAQIQILYNMLTADQVEMQMPAAIQSQIVLIQPETASHLAHALNLG